MNSRLVVDRIIRAQHKLAPLHRYTKDEAVAKAVASALRHLEAAVALAEEEK